MPGKYRLVCWTCRHEGHRAADCPTKWGLLPEFEVDQCARCGKKGHKTKWCGLKKGAPPLQTVKAMPKKQKQGNARRPPRSKKEGCPYEEKGDEVLGV